MGVAGGVDRDAGVEVEEAVAVDVLDHGAGTTPDDERIGAVSEGLVKRSSRSMIVARHRSGQLGRDPRCSLRRQFGGAERRVGERCAHGTPRRRAGGLGDEHLV